MSRLFFSSDAEALVDRLLVDLASPNAASPIDPFIPTTIVVPNRFVQQWLKFRIAKARGVAINLQFAYLETALWDWLREIDPRPHDVPPELLDDERYSLLTLSILWNDEAPALAPLRSFIDDRGGPRVKCRRAWHAAQTLGRLIREYEYHRQDQIIQPWLDPRAVVEVPPAWREREAGQRAVFERVIKVPDGRRAALNRELRRNFKTLPQYVMELLNDVGVHKTPPRRVIHLFGLTSISPLHMRAIELLGKSHDWRVYHINPLASRLKSIQTLGQLRGVVKMFRVDPTPEARVAEKPGDELTRIWGRAGAEGLDLVANLLRDPSVRGSIVGSRERGPASTVLRRVQSSLLGGELSPDRLLQDTSLQIVRCPGIWREAETIHAAIVQALDRDPKLRQTDIAVLVSDMDAYRPVLTAVFERPPRLISYGLADYSAARVSVFGQALVGMLDLALENLSRTRVFEVLLNPCVLARLGVERDAALHWLTWAENLGIYHGWDAAEKREQGYVGTPLYSWKLGLQKLRLGQYMDVVAEDAAGAAPQWRGVVPFGDVESGDRERLGQFCLIVEGLLPMLVALRGKTATAGEWSQTILKLLQRFLAVPEDRPEEEPVRDALIESLTRFREWDVLHGANAATSPVPLALVREFVAGHLQGISGRRHDVLSSGVTIAALAPQRPVPFEMIVLGGMDEQCFPGGAAPSPFDLRQVQRRPGDILPVEQQRMAFFEAVLSAKQKLIVTYNARDLQKDEDRQIAVPVAQLERFVSRHILADGDFKPVTVPLLAHDVAYLDDAAKPKYQDILVQERDVDRVLSIDQAVAAKRMTVMDLEQPGLDKVRRLRWPASATATEATPQSATLTLSQLRAFLDNPAAAAARYHLRVDDEWSEQLDEDHEPLTSPRYLGERLVRRTLEHFVRRAETESPAALAALVDDWPAEFDAKYEEWTLRGKLPEGAFAAVDREALRDEVRSHLDGADGDGLIRFLHAQTMKTCCGPLLVGESLTPVGAKKQLGALTVNLTRPLPYVAGNEARIVGDWPFVWEDETSIDLLVLEPGDSDNLGPLNKSLFTPLLFALVLAALGEVKGRRVTLMLVRGAIEAVELKPEWLEPAAAKVYLAELATDCLDRACADLLPYSVIRKSELYGIYQCAEDESLAGKLDREFRNKEDERGSSFGDARFDDLHAMGFRPPAGLDAYRKARRRFVPLHRLLPDAPPPRNATSRRRCKGEVV